METKIAEKKATAPTLTPARAKVTLREVIDTYMDKVVRVTVTNATNPDKTTESMQVTCKATDLKVGFGNIRVKVEPVGGSGYIWVSTDRIELA